MSTATRQTDRPTRATRTAAEKARTDCWFDLDLGPSPPRLRWKTRREIGGKGAAIDRFGEQDERVIELASDLSPKEAVLVCAHEMRHMHQYENWDVVPNFFRSAAETNRMEKDAKRYEKVALKRFEEEHFSPWKH